jgi:hypothetical protein
MDPLTERVLEDRFWWVILMAVIAFFWFHHWDNGRSSRLTEAVGKTPEISKATLPPKKDL